MTTRKIIGAKIKTRREAMGYLLKDIVPLVGISLSSVKGVESGTAKDIDLYLKYAEFVKCSIDLICEKNDFIKNSKTYKPTDAVRTLLKDSFFDIPKFAFEVRDKLLSLDLIDENASSSYVSNILTNLEEQGEINVDRSNKIHKYYK
ncbi:helix-turn-helix domain-containing protein [Myroides pelagicus]|uniref:HTH cro/C1-type domain-containing protein n=1 Tax=Myroides pelagicus TaxID=270914 RepID=A0A7K1GNA8_9FLAO|nr:helix-turn-helix transcriptional regulator [Myroides pelagicus]MTH30392.1 hypothetical protein [Myroides pelagicus]